MCRKILSDNLKSEFGILYASETITVYAMAIGPAWKHITIKPSHANNFSSQIYNHTVEQYPVAGHVNTLKFNHTPLAWRQCLAP